MKEKRFTRKTIKVKNHENVHFNDKALFRSYEQNEKQS